jgi:hypothetical protein
LFESKLSNSADNETLYDNDTSKIIAVRIVFATFVLKTNLLKIKMKKLLTVAATLSLLAFTTSCGPSEEDRKKQDSLSDKAQDSAAEALFNDAMKDLENLGDSAKADSLKKDSAAKAAAAQPKK